MIKGDNMINNIKYIRYSKDEQCMLRYHTDIRGYNEYWYNDLHHLLKNYEFIVIDSFVLPMDNGSEIGVKFLKEFCDVMTAGNKVVVIDTEEFARYLENVSGVYYDACMAILDEMLTEAGFDQISTNQGHSYLYKEVYVYTKAKAGMQVYDEIENYYGLVEQDLFWS